MTTSSEATPAATARDGEHAALLAVLTRMGAVPAGAHVTVASLTGGVSNDVVSVTGTAGGAPIDVVVKHALPRLRVEAEWLASPTRILDEARALRLAAEVLPGRVPAVFQVAPEDHVIVIERAPRDFVEWRTALLGGHVDPSVAQELGRCLARWHRATTDDDDVRSGFGDATLFGQLRVEPFYRRISALHAPVAQRVDGLVERMLSTRRCLVHGDYSPKNVMVGQNGLWVIDWEVAHLGDPVFDLAFMIAHLVCKALHRPADAAVYRNAADSFLVAYDATGSSAAGRDDAYLVHQIACLVLARIDGKSPVAYLDEDARGRGRTLTLAVLQAEAPRWADLWTP